MSNNNKKPNRAGNTNKSGGSYKEKQPMAKPKKNNEVLVDEDGDGKSDHSVDGKQKKTKTSTGD
jgi:hypothetical protein